MVLPTITAPWPRISTAGLFANTLASLAGVPATTRLAPHWYSPAAHAEVYSRMRERAAAWLARGEHVILDAAFLGRRERELARRVAVEQGAEFRIAECVCPDAVIRDRLLAREADGGCAADAR